MHRVVYLFIFDTRYTHTAVKPSLDWPQYGMICFGHLSDGHSCCFILWNCFFLLKIFCCYTHMCVTILHNLHIVLRNTFSILH